MIYAGIGSRETPQPALDFMRKCAKEWAQKEWTLRSGGAEGADLAFENGAIDGGGPLEIFYKDRLRVGYSDKESEDRLGKFGQTNVYPYNIAHYDKAMEIAEHYHPNWGACKPFARRLHARNSFIILGSTLDNPVELVVCWTEGAKLKGGTAQGLRIALDYGIPIANLGHEAYQLNA